MENLKNTIALVTSRDTHLTVQMPYSLFCRLVELMDKGDPLTESLMRVCNRTQSQEEYGVLRWQTFENLHSNVEAIREMLFREN